MGNRPTGAVAAKGFAMDDERLKQAVATASMEPPVRIQYIRPSERVFLSKVLDIYPRAWTAIRARHNAGGPCQSNALN
jgi:hypothetical protein